MTEELGLAKKQSLRAWLFNPFQYVAGGTALALGVPIVLVAGLNSSLSGSHFDGVLDFHTGAGMPLWFSMAEGLTDWLAMSMLLLAAGRLISKSRFRAIDVFGTQALARVPTLGTAAFVLLPGYQRQAARFVALNMQTPPADMAAFIVVSVGVLAMLVWMVVLMYRAFSVSCNVKGTPAMAAFGVTLLLAEVISKLVLTFLFRFAVV